MTLKKLNGCTCRVARAVDVLDTVPQRDTADRRPPVKSLHGVDVDLQLGLALSVRPGRERLGKDRPSLFAGRQSPHLDLVHRRGDSDSLQGHRLGVGDGAGLDARQGSEGQEEG